MKRRKSFLEELEATLRQQIMWSPPMRRGEDDARSLSHDGSAALHDRI